MKRCVAKYLSAIVAGGVTALAFPLADSLVGIEGANVVWIGLVPLLVVCCFSSPWQSLWLGYSFGLAFFGGSLFWITALRHSWGNAPLAFLAYAALVAYCAVYPGLFAWAWTKCRLRYAAGLQLKDRMVLIALAPVLWVATEWIRGFGALGFPWNVLGVSQYANRGLIQVADVCGVLGISFLIVLLNAALAMTLVRYYLLGRGGTSRRRMRFHAELALGLLAVAMCWFYGARKVLHGRYDSEAVELRVALVQPAIPQVMKWDAEHTTMIMQTLERQSDLALSGSPDLMVWPETVTPGMLRHHQASLELAVGVATNGVQLLAGTMDMDILPDGREGYFNAAILMEEAGFMVGTYHKRHLVPFGEYLPVLRHFGSLDRLSPLGFSCEFGDRDQQLIRVTKSERSIKLGVLICFEDVFSHLSRHDVRRGARLLVNQTNDAWFDGSAALRQHLAHAVFRAIENRVPLVRAANTGISAYISASGRITAVPGDGSAGVRGFSVRPVRVETGPKTLSMFTRFGDWLLAIPCVMLSILLVMMSYVKQKAGIDE